MRKIFISYRHNDTDMAAGRLAADLRKHFGEEAVFRDKESIAGGADWEEEIRSAIGPDGAVLALIGKHWLETDAEGLRRIDDPQDTHREEVAAALKLGCLIIPVLVSEAAMPRKESLPEQIGALTRFNALKLRDDEWDGFDFPRLTKKLENSGFEPKAKPTAPDPDRLDSVKGKDEAAADDRAIHQASKHVAQSPKPANESASEGKPGAVANHEKGHLPWSRKLLSSLTIQALALILFLIMLSLYEKGYGLSGAVEDMMVWLLAVAAVAGLVFGLLGWKEARRGLVRSSGLGILAICANSLFGLVILFGIYHRYLN